LEKTPTASNPFLVVVGVLSNNQQEAIPEACCCWSSLQQPVGCPGGLNGKIPQNARNPKISLPNG
jgi:hypothetical protein